MQNNLQTNMSTNMINQSNPPLAALDMLMTTLSILNLQVNYVEAAQDTVVEKRGMSGCV
jgi:hypothetical protein